MNEHFIMGKARNLSPCRIVQISTLLSETTLKQREIAYKLGVSKQTVSAIKRKMDHGENFSLQKVLNYDPKKPLPDKTEK